MFPFNVRVYGICITASGHILLSDEKYHNQYFTKFPGGGLEFGEGTIDCIKRELQEEHNLVVTNCTHFYTTDFFITSLFNPKQQVLSIYYKIEIKNLPELPISNTFSNLSSAAMQEEKLRLVAIKDLDETCVSFPIDKCVINKLIALN